MQIGIDLGATKIEYVLLDNNNIEIKRDRVHTPKDYENTIKTIIQIVKKLENSSGKFNIGITAGIETTAVSNAWIEGCNKMDLVIVPSEHAKIGFAQSAYEKACGKVTSVSGGGTWLSPITISVSFNNMKC